jgi:hypothetical protein
MTKYCPIISVRPTGILDYIQCIGEQCQFFDTDQDNICIFFQLRKVKPQLKDIKDLLTEINNKT